jgi:hypothetical protein
LGGESKEKESRRVHAYIPQQILKKTASKSLQEKRQEKAPKSPKRKTGKNSNRLFGTTPNHLYIP